MAASWAAAGCNTNLGILLLCAPVAVAFERLRSPLTRLRSPVARECLRRAIGDVLGDLDLADARAAYRAIALASPGGLGAADAQDVRHPPSIGLRAAMALAAERDLIARQYRDGFTDLFDLALPELPAGFSLNLPAALQMNDAPPNAAPDAQTISAVQRVYLTLLATLADSHIVRKHGAAVAQNVMAAAQGFQVRALRGDMLDADPEFALWDQALKARNINPGTTADLTVAALLIAGLTNGPMAES